MFFFFPSLNEDSISRVHTCERDEDIVGRVSVEGLLEELLVEVVTNETDGSTENEETVQTAEAELSKRTINVKKPQTHAPIFM